MGLFNNFTKKQLQRKNLVNIIENWDKRKETSIDKEAYLTYLNKLEEEINKHSYKNDDRFITYGRRDFLRREFTERLNFAVQANDTNKYINALVDLEEYIYTQNYISITSIPNNETKDFRKLDKINTEYYNSGIICKEEKDIIVDMIQEFKQKLKETDNENLTIDKNAQQQKNRERKIQKSVKDMLSEDTYNKLKKLYIGELDIIFFERENIDAGQIGFRYTGCFNEIGEIIDGWLGNEYVIIGYDSTAGCGPDPYIMKTDEKELPIYWLMTDGGDWNNPDKIANSFNDFIKIIACINENLNSENEPNKELILSEIRKINSNENMEYWENLLENNIDSNL